MGRPSKRKSEALQIYIKTLKTCFPEAEIQPMAEPFAGADFGIRVEVPEDKVEDVLDKTAELGYDWYMKYKVNILASVSGAGPVKAGV